jgi:hypothetical protein
MKLGGSGQKVIGEYVMFPTLPDEKWRLEVIPLTSRVQENGEYRERGSFGRYRDTNYTRDEGRQNVVPGSEFRVSKVGVSLSPQKLV